MYTRVQDIACSASERVSYAPLYDRVAAEMLVACGRGGREFDFGEAWPLSVLAPWRSLLGADYSSISEANGLAFTVDSIHFGEKFAGVCEDLVMEWIRLVRRDMVVG